MEKRAFKNVTVTKKGHICDIIIIIITTKCLNM